MRQMQVLASYNQLKSKLSPMHLPLFAPSSPELVEHPMARAHEVEEVSLAISDRRIIWVSYF